MRRSPDEYLARHVLRAFGPLDIWKTTAVQGIACGATVAEDTPPALRGESASIMIGSVLYVNTSTHYS